MVRVAMLFEQSEALQKCCDAADIGPRRNQIDDGGQVPCHLFGRSSDRIDAARRRSGSRGQDARKPQKPLQKLVHAPIFCLGLFRGYLFGIPKAGQRSKEWQHLGDTFRRAAVAIAPPF